MKLNRAEANVAAGAGGARRRRPAELALTAVSRVLALSDVGKVCHGESPEARGSRGWGDADLCLSLASTLEFPTRARGRRRLLALSNVCMGVLRSCKTEIGDAGPHVLALMLSLPSAAKVLLTSVRTPNVIGAMSSAAQDR